MKRNTIRRTLLSSRGMTLVELMIVVAIIGILASLAGVAFFKQIKQAKIRKLEGYAMDLARGQEEFYSRHGSYYPIDNSQLPLFSGSDAPNAGTRLVVKQVMGFSHNDLPSDVTVRISAGRMGQTCQATVCNGNEATVDTKTAWYAISVSQDMNPGDPRNTTVLVSSSLQSPLVTNEGM